MSTSLFAMGVFTLVGAITPGPVNVLALRHGAGMARLACALYVLGASASYAAVVWIMGRGAQQMLLAVPQLALAAQWLCAAYLLHLAWQLAHAPVQGAMGREGAGEAGARPRWQGLARAFGQGAAVQALNPKAWLVALAGVGLFVLPRPDHSWALLQFCTMSLLACLLGVGCWALLGQWLAGWLRTERRQRLLHRMLAGLLVASVAGMLA